MSYNNVKYIYESPDKGKTVYRREFGKLERKLIQTHNEDIHNEQANSTSPDNLAKQ